MTYFTIYTYNFCWPVRTLREPIGEGRWSQRRPAMAAGLADHIWAIREWITMPAVQRSSDTTQASVEPVSNSWTLAPCRAHKFADRAIFADSDDCAEVCPSVCRQYRGGPLPVSPPLLVTQGGLGGDSMTWVSEGEMRHPESSRHPAGASIVYTLGLSFCLVAGGCIGPRSVELTRLRYDQAVHETTEQQWLRNIVRLRYGDTPSFLDVSAITSQFELSGSGSITGGRQRDSVNRTLFGDTSLQFRDAPTLSYTPRDPAELTRAMVAPVGITAMGLMGNNGWRLRRRAPTDRRRSQWPGELPRRRTTRPGRRAHTDSVRRGRPAGWRASPPPRAGPRRRRRSQASLSRDLKGSRRRLRSRARRQQGP